MDPSFLPALIDPVGVLSSAWHHRQHVSEAQTVSSTAKHLDLSITSLSTAVLQMLFFCMM